MSESKDDVLMWSHYAFGHRGFCLEFKDPSKIIWGSGGINKDVKIPLICKKVTYHKKYPIFRYPFRKSTKKNLFREITSKAHFWTYEKEWRILHHSIHGDKGIRLLPKRNLSKVIFGLKMSEKDKRQIIRWLKQGEYSPKLYQAELKHTEYGIDIVPYAVTR